MQKSPNKAASAKKKKHAPVHPAFSVTYPASSAGKASPSRARKGVVKQATSSTMSAGQNKAVFDLERLKRLAGAGTVVASDNEDDETNLNNEGEEESTQQSGPQKEVIFPKSEFEYDRSLEPVQPFRGFTSKIRELIAESFSANNNNNATSSSTQEVPSASLAGFLQLLPIDKAQQDSNKTAKSSTITISGINHLESNGATRFKGNWNAAATTSNSETLGSGAPQEGSDASSSEQQTGRLQDPIPKKPVTSAWVYLHNEVIAYRNHVAPSPADLEERERIVELVRSVAKELWPESATRVFGSSATGLCLPDSDVDICVFDASPNAIHRLANAFKTRRMVEMIQVLDRAYVPIIKLRFASSPFTADISFDQPGGIHTATFIKNVMERMPEVKPLVLVIKHFLAQRDLNETYKGGMGSYLCFLSVVAVCQRARRINPDQPENLASLLLQYFDFYGNILNYDEVGISLANGGHFFRKQDRAWSAGPAEKAVILCLEDPMNPEVDIGKKSYKMNMVRHAFSIAHSHLKRKLEGLDVARAVEALNVLASRASSLKRRRKSSEEDDKQLAMDVSILATVIRLDSKATIESKRVRLGRNVTKLDSSEEEDLDDDLYMDEDDDDED